MVWILTVNNLSFFKFKFCKPFLCILSKFFDMYHGAGKVAKQIKQIAMTSNIDFLNQYAARILWKKKKVNFSITFREIDIFLKSYFLQEVGVGPLWCCHAPILLVHKSWVFKVSYEVLFVFVLLMSVLFYCIL